MKKVAIISIYGNENFGNKLQNYAVQTICKKLGFNSSIIRITDRTENKLIFTLKSFVCDEILQRWYRNKNFWLFERRYLKTSKRYYFSQFDNKKLNDKYDCFIVGSDQVWNPYFGVKGNLTFLEFVKSKPKVALSASFGVSKIDNELHEKYINGLKNLDYISVREDVGKMLAENFSNRKDIEVLIDPTMMLSKEEWQKVSKKPKKLGNEKYILNYFLGSLSEERKSKIYSLAKKFGYKIINILDKNDPFFYSGPSEFVYLEEHAELICTDSFHACVFGIIMNKPIVIFNREDKLVKMNSRIDTLLSKFNLSERRYNKELTEKHLICDYSENYKILEKERKKAEDFLKKALRK